MPGRSEDKWETAKEQVWPVVKAHHQGASVEATLTVTAHVPRWSE